MSMNLCCPRYICFKLYLALPTYDVEYKNIQETVKSRLAWLFSFLSESQSVGGAILNVQTKTQSE